MTYALRPATPSDLGTIHELQRRIEIADQIPIASPRAEFDEWLDEPHFDLAADARVVHRANEVVAWGRIWHQPSGEREERAYVFGAVHPEHRGRGVGSELMRWQIGRASEVLPGSNVGLPCFIRAQVYDFQHSAIRLFQRHGLSPVRYIDELLRDLTDHPAPIETPGIDILPWDPKRSEAARHAHNEAFADHWGYTPRDPETWEHLQTTYGWRPDLSFLALDGSQVIGVCRSAHFPEDEAVNGRRDGWTMQVSVIPSHRKRGIASAMIAASLEAFRAAGFTHAALAVDSDNPTGAYRIYERLGYQRMHRSVVYQRQVDSATVASK
jgi:ribosomal protein S18 acetylase RimI-like enzyme